MQQEILVEKNGEKKKDWIWSEILYVAQREKLEAKLNMQS